MGDYPTTMSEALPDAERVAEARARLEEAGVKYILSCWIDLLGVPKTKPVPLSDLELLCAGKGPQFAVHSVSFVPSWAPPIPTRSRSPISTAWSSAPGTSAAPGSSPICGGRTSPITCAREAR